jgi:hypothetical protein
VVVKAQADRLDRASVRTLGTALGIDPGTRHPERPGGRTRVAAARGRNVRAPIPWRDERIAPAERRAPPRTGVGA